MIDTQDLATVVSLFPLPVREMKPGVYPGRFDIDPSKNGVPSLLVIGQSIHRIYIGENRPDLEMAISSSEMARSIVEDFISAQIAINDFARPGLGWLRGEVGLVELQTKHTEFLSQLRQQHKAWNLELIKMADDDWQRYHKHTVISDIERLAAKDLGYLDKDWLIIPESLPSAACPACGTPVVPSIVVCPNCRCILDKEKYAKLSFAQ